MPTTLKYIIIVIAIIVFLLITIGIVFSIISKKQTKKMNEDIQKLLEDAKNSTNGELLHEAKDEYDYILKTTKYYYYIKIIPNFSNQEITINNATKWQLRRTINDTSLRYVENVEPLMRMDVSTTVENRETIKLYIIYPTAKTLLRYINECEMEFVSHKTDVYGTKVVTYNNLLSNRDSILK